MKWQQMAEKRGSELRARESNSEMPSSSTLPAGSNSFYGFSYGTRPRLEQAPLGPKVPKVPTQDPPKNVSLSENMMKEGERADG